MESLEKDLYSAAFRKWEISPSSKAHGYGPDGALRTFENDFGEGEYWSYFRGNLFAINSFNMKFTKNWVLRYRCTEHLCIGFYDEIEGVAQRRGAPLSVGAISVYLGEEDEEYEARVLEGASAKGTSITFSPDYYRTYLQGRFGSIRDIRRAFLEADGRRDMPDLVDLLRKARSLPRHGDCGGALLRRGDLGSRRYRHAAFLPVPRKARRHAPVLRRPQSHRFHLRIHRVQPRRRPFLLPSCGRALHRADEIENPLQGGNGDVAIPLRRTRAHGGSIQTARRDRLHDSRDRQNGGIRQARRIHGGVPEGQGLHAYAVQKRALAPDRRNEEAPPPTKPIASASRLKSRAACSTRSAVPEREAPLFLPVILPGSRGSFSRRLHCGPRSCSRAGVSPSQPPSTRPGLAREP